MSLEFYRLLHFLGIFMLFSGLGAYLLGRQQVLKTEAVGRFPYQRTVAIIHGLGLFLILLGGFGMLARLQLGIETWVAIKLVIWLMLGGVLVLIKRVPSKMLLWWLLILVLGFCAAYLAVIKLT